MGGKNGKMSRNGRGLLFSGTGLVSSATRSGCAMVGLVAMIGVKSIVVMKLEFAISVITGVRA